MEFALRAVIRHASGDLPLYVVDIETAILRRPIHLAKAAAEPSTTMTTP
jgi:hypothetical protein